MRALFLVPTFIFGTLTAFASGTIAPMSANASFEKIGIRCDGSQEIISPNYTYRFGISVKDRLQNQRCDYDSNEKDLCDVISGHYGGSISNGSVGANERGGYVLKKHLSTGKYTLQYFFEAGGGQNISWDPTVEFSNVNAQIWTEDQVILPQSYIYECPNKAGAYIYRRLPY